VEHENSLKPARTFNIVGKYKSTVTAEVLDTADTLAEAQEMLREYKLSYGKDWRIWITTINTL
jgi:hypothetical protein